MLNPTTTTLLATALLLAIAAPSQAQLSVSSTNPLTEAFAQLEVTDDGSQCELVMGPHTAHVSSKGVGPYYWRIAVKVGTSTVFERTVSSDSRVLISEFSDSGSFVANSGTKFTASATIQHTILPGDRATATDTYMCGSGILGILDLGSAAASSSVPATPEEPTVPLLTESLLPAEAPPVFGKGFLL